MLKIFTVTMAPVNPPYDDGVKNLVINLARRLRNERFSFVSSMYGKSFPTEDNIVFYRSPFQATGKHSMSLLQKMYVFSLVLGNMKNTDIFQFFVTPQPYFSGVFKKLMKTPGTRSIQVLSSIHTLYGKNGPSGLSDLFFGDRVVVYSDFAAKELGNMGVKNVVRIYPGIDVEKYAAGQGMSIGALSMSVRRPRILFAGSYKVLDGAYPFADFCRIARDVTSKYPGAEFVMACRMRSEDDKRLRKEFTRCAEEEGVRGSFTFLDTVENMPELIESCDIGMMPAARPMQGVLEIPMIILEMASAGKPVVYGNVHPLEELAGKGVGVMAEGAAPGDYSVKMIELIKDKVLSSVIGKRSRDAVIEHFNIDSVAAEYEKLYRSLETEGAQWNG